MNNAMCICIKQSEPALAKVVDCASHTNVCRPDHPENQPCALETMAPFNLSENN